MAINDRMIHGYQLMAINDRMIYGYQRYDVSWLLTIGRLHGYQR